MPPGVVNLVTGGADVGTVFSTHDEIKVVSFTGSTAVGRLVNQNAAPGFKKVHLEMGGKNVIMVMDDAHLELAVEGCLWGGFGTTGQRCTAASRVVVHEKVYDEFLAGVFRARRVAARRERRAGRRADGAVDQRGAARHGDEVRRDREAGGRDARHRRTSPRGRAYARGWFPRADDLRRRDAVDAHRAGRDLRAGRVGHAVPARSTRRSRSATAWRTACRRRFTRATSTRRSPRCATYTGIFYVNAPTIGAEVHLPFGGTKATGNGHREAGIAALDVFSEWKSIYVDFSGKLQRAQIDTEA